MDALVGVVLGYARMMAPPGVAETMAVLTEAVTGPAEMLGISPVWAIGGVAVGMYVSYVTVNALISLIVMAFLALVWRTLKRVFSSTAFWLLAATFVPTLAFLYAGSGGWRLSSAAEGPARLARWYLEVYNA